MRHGSTGLAAPTRLVRRRNHPARVLAGLLAGAVAVSAVLVSAAAPGVTRFPFQSAERSPAPGNGPASPALTFAALSDTTDLDSLGQDSTAVDSSLADSLADTSLAARYLPGFQGDGRSASLFQRTTRPMSAGLGNYWRHEVTLDSVTGQYVIRESVGGQDVRYPVWLDRDAYRQVRLQDGIQGNWSTLAGLREQQRQNQRRGGLGVNIVVPGGRQSAFSTIFGAPQVDLRVTGQANIQAGFDHRKSDQNVIATLSSSRIDPLFKQDLSLGIVGTIGDKLKVNVSWDTKNQFDYQNQLKLTYEGYADEIIQRVEAGNVFLQTPSQLIRGGQSLFGIKSEFQVGGVRIQTVASQQEGQANSLNIEGGSQPRSFQFTPTDYDDGTHFFLGYYFRNRFEDALSEPPRIIVQRPFSRISHVEVWRLGRVSPGAENVRNVVALADLAESPEILDLADAYTDDSFLPHEGEDQYPDAEVENNLREGRGEVASYLQSKGLDAEDYQIGSFQLLDPSREYDFDPALGYLSLRQRLQDNEALAVAYVMETDAGPIKVGDQLNASGGSSGSINDRKMVLKLLRPVQLKAPSENNNPAAWYLEMRNIYSLNSYGINGNEFELEIKYRASGKAPISTLPGSNETLLAQLGLDRVDQERKPGRDYQFDYLNGYTILEDRGLIIFPYLEPFGSRMQEVIEASGDPALIADSSSFVFRRLYTQRKDNARKDTKLDVYNISGSYKGAVQSFYDLNSFAGLIPGSVVVTSGGTPLQEGTDFTVDYQGGTVNIINPQYLTAGRAINITYEQNQFFNIQKKTLLGARAQYGTEDQPLQLGATLFRLNQKSPVDKFRLGDEPISNTIWGLDGRLDLQPRWLTRALDALPLLQTRQESSINIQAEFAALRPGNAQTFAFERTRKEMLRRDRDFTEDELGGVSYLDDFEGFENTFSLKQPGGWILSAAPDSFRDESVPVGDDAEALRSYRRGLFGWYTLHSSAVQQLEGEARLPIHSNSVASVLSTQVFPNKPSLGGPRDLLSVLDLYFNPHERGPYNYTPDLRGFLEQPELAWGGMTQRLPDGYNDFSLKNIEFIEMIISPYAENAENEAGEDAVLYLNLGSISEDVIPDGYLNLEDGLSTDEVDRIGDSSPWARLANGTRNTVLDVEERTRRTEDLGLDGLASYDPEQYSLPGTADLTEHAFFREFLDGLDDASTDPRYAAEVAKARRDPSGDDFFYFRDSDYFNDPLLFPETATIQQRFSRFFSSSELNSFAAQNELGKGRTKQGISTYPDTEDLNNNSTVDADNSYYEYAIPLSLSRLRQLSQPDQVDDYVVTRISGSEADPGNPGWFLVRIPVREITSKVGNIDDFTLIESIRLWTTGHKVPMTVRVASLELVGSQWQTAEDVNEERVIVDAADAHLSISSINNEENSKGYVPPVGTVMSQIRSTLGTDAVNAREQSMVMRIEDLSPGDQRAIYKTYRGENLLKYENVRMYVHMHGLTDLEGDLAALAEHDLERARSKARLFIRFGSNQSDDYYEYEQPLTPSNPDAEGSDYAKRDHLWRTNQTYGGQIIDLNSVNIELAAFNRLKVVRDDSLGNGSVDLGSVFWSTQTAGYVDPKFAPPGTRLGVKGNPTLDRVNTIVIGIRNPEALPGGASNASKLEDVTVWVNELRVSGYDNKGGMAGLFNADIGLADFGRIKANFNAQTDGFGELTSTLGDRDQASLNTWGVNANLNLDKLLPERYGWRLPVSVQVQSNTTTPRYSPQAGDIELREMTSVQETREEKREIIEAAQTHSYSRSFTASIQKTDSESRLLRNTLDGVQLNYSYSDAAARNPSTRLSDSWRWTGSAAYRLNVRKPRTMRPFWFLEPLPLLGLLGDLRLNYLPQSVTASGTASRNYSASQQRDLTKLDPIAYEIKNPLREQHAFTHRRGLTFQYNPLTFLNLGYDMNVNQSLNQMSAYPVERRLDSVVVMDLEPTPLPLVIGRLFTGSVHRPRTEQYDQRFTATLQPKLTKVKPLNWILIQPITYSAVFGWNNGPLDQIAGARVTSSLDLKAGISLKPQDFWKKFDFYKNMEKAQKDAEQQAKSERQKRVQEATKRREAARAEKARLRAIKDAAQDSTAAPDSASVQAEAPAEGTDEARRRMEEEYRNRSMAPPPAEGAPVRADTLNAPAATPPTTPAPAELEAEKPRRSFPISLPRPDPLAFLRRSFLALTGVKDFTVTLTSNARNDASNVGLYDSTSNTVDVHYSILDALKGRGPGLGYRLGFDRRLGPEQRTFDREQKLRITDDLSQTTRLLARTTISPSSALNVNLNWNADWGARESFSYLSPTETAEPTYTGSNSASVWAFGASYLDVFERQLATFTEDFNGRRGNENTFGDLSGDGRVALTNRSTVDDFRGVYVRSPRWLGSQALLPLPMPAWQVTYSGISNWPIIRSLVQSATLKHGYNADYRTDHQSAMTQEDTLRTSLGSLYTLEYGAPDLNINTVRVSERYQPLIGADFSFKGNLAVGVDWNRSNSFSYSPGTIEVGELKTDQISATLSYQKQGLTLPFLPGKRLNNRISLSMTVSWDESSDTRYKLKNALVEAATAMANGEGYDLADVLTGNNVSRISDTQRFTISPKIAYQFSNRVSADFSIKRETFLSKDSRTPSYVNTTGGFNVRVSISN